jgi:hypothetical protein
MCNVLEILYSFPGFTLLLATLLQDISAKSKTYLPGTREILSLVLQHSNFSRVFWILDAYSFTCFCNPGNLEFPTYFMEFLENPKQSGTHVFDQQCYAIATKECLQLCLCSYHHFSRRVIESAFGDKMLHKHKPWAWRGRLGVHSRIRKSRHWLRVKQHKKIKTRCNNSEFLSFSKEDLKNVYYLSLVYKWALDLLPLLLERSTISLELAKMLDSCTFTMMALDFAWRLRVAKDAMRRYILQVESVMDKP